MRAAWLSLALLCACNTNNDDPASYVTGLRLLGVKATPPEVPLDGGAVTVEALAVDTGGRAIDASWAQCTAVPVGGGGVNPDCITGSDAGEVLLPLGSGLGATLAFTALPPSSFGRPDASGGVYVPIIAHLSADADGVAAAYLLRVGLGLPPNHNPTLTDVVEYTPPGDGGAEATAPLDDANPRVLHAGDTLTLRALFADGSAETYPVYDGDPRTTAPRMLTETLSVSWFATAGSFAGAPSGADVADVVFHLDQPKNGPSPHLPASGATIDLWAVARDERGGAAWLHKTLKFE